jgi:hypothetical protein
MVRRLQDLMLHPKIPNELPEKSNSSKKPS